jgi:tetratricopeptide (TPR) repeat protein
VSLIADSLKKAVKEKSAPKWETDPEINPVGKREPIKRPGLSTVFSVLLLIVLPTAVLVYLISIGAFSLKKASVKQKPDVPVSVPTEEARVSPPLKPAPEVSLEKPVAVSPIKPTKPTKKASVKKEAVALKTADKSLVRKKEKTVVKKVVPSSPPKKKSTKPEKLANDVPKEKGVVLSSPDLKPASPVVPKIPPVATEKKILAVPPVQPTETPLTEATPDLGKKAVVPEETPALKPSEMEIPDHEIATRPEPPAKPSGEPVVEKAKVSSEQKTAEKPEIPAKLPLEPVVEKAEVISEKETAPAVAEKKILAEVPKETPASKPEVAEILDQKVAAKSEVPAQPSVEPVLEKPLSSPAISDAVKGNSEIASLPPSSVKPEISRFDPLDKENVFNNSDYYFNRGIFFQQAGDWKKALDNYSKSEELDPNNPDTYNNKGVVLKEMGKYDQALDEFLRAVYLDAGYAKAYNNIGVVYFMQKNYPEAIRHYLRAIDLNPTNLEAFNNLAIIYKKQKESDKARGVLNRALSLDPDHPGTNYNLAVLYEENSEIKPALHFYRRFIELGAINYPSLVIQVKEHLEGMKPR